MTGIKRKNWFERNFSFIGLYYHVCRYGESYMRPIGWASLIVYESTIYFWHENIVLNYVSSSDFIFVLTMFTDAGKRSLSALFPFFELEKTELVDYFVRLTLLPILGTIFIALRRKLERRFRH